MHVFFGLVRRHSNVTKATMAPDRKRSEHRILKQV